MKTIIALLLLFPALVRAQIITTVAGNGTYASTGDGGSATAAGLLHPDGLALDKNGNLFFSEFSRIRKVNAAGVITTVAGTGTEGYNGDGIPATTAQIFRPGDIATDTGGNIYFADEGNKRIRRIDALTNIITTVAGDGGDPASADYISGTNVSSSSIGSVKAMCMDKLGNIYISNGFDVGKIAPSGIITLVAGGGAFSSSTYFYSTQPATAIAFDFENIYAIHVDAAGNLYIKLFYLPFHAFTPYAAIVKVDAAGILSQYAGNGTGGYYGDGGMATDAKIGGNCKGLTTDKEGNLYFSAYLAVRKVDVSGIICTVAGNGAYGFSGDGSIATNAQLDEAHGIAIDTSGNLFIAAISNNRIRKVTQPVCANIYMTDVAAAGNSNELSIYPNPATSQLTISTSYPIATIAISNIVGQTVYTQHYHSAKADINVAGLPAGVYLIRINDTEIRRFVKE